MSTTIVADQLMQALIDMSSALGPSTEGIFLATDIARRSRSLLINRIKPPTA
jgi:orotate phosphoribosyltransferase